MKLLQIFNQYRSPYSGEEAVVQATARLIEQQGGETRLFLRSSRDIRDTWTGRVRAFCSSFYNFSSYHDVWRTLREFRPDVVHAHNLFPLLSPSVLVACRRHGVPVVLTIHNQQLTCPRADHLYRGNICERCVGGREMHCVLRNCRGDLWESVAYAARSAFARRLRLFHDNVDCFITPSWFGHRRLLQAGVARDRVALVPNMVEIPDQPCDPAAGRYVAFAGRISSEKGIDTLIAAARRVPTIEFRCAGDGPLLERARRTSPPNIHWLGQLRRGELNQLYRGARCGILPSRTYEMCPLALLEAMSHGLPVLASSLGAQAELVDDGVSGFLTPPNDATALADRVARLFGDDELCRAQGQAARCRVLEQHSPAMHLQKLLDIYERVAGRSLRDQAGGDPPGDSCDDVEALAARCDS